MCDTKQVHSILDLNHPSTHLISDSKDEKLSKKEDRGPSSRRESTSAALM